MRNLQLRAIACGSLLYFLCLPVCQAIEGKDPYYTLPLGTQVIANETLLGRWNGITGVQNGQQLVGMADFGVYCAFYNMQACGFSSSGTQCTLGPKVDLAVSRYDRSSIGAESASFFEGSGQLVGLWCLNTDSTPVSYSDLLLAVGSLVTFKFPDEAMFVVPSLHVDELPLQQLLQVTKSIGE